MTIGATQSANYYFTNWTTTGTSTVAYSNQSQAISSVTSNLSYTANGASCASTTNFSYTGGVQNFTPPCTGTYKLETWGAQGGYTDSGGVAIANFYGWGGYAYGNYSATAGTKLYIVVGGQGVCGINGTC